jgi:hypothetical protein
MRRFSYVRNTGGKPELGTVFEDRDDRGNIPRGFSQVLAPAELLLCRNSALVQLRLIGSRIKPSASAAAACRSLHARH